MVDDRLKRLANHTTEKAEIAKSKTIAGAYILRKMRTFTGTDRVEKWNGSALRYPMKMLNTFSHGSALAEHMLNLKKGFIDMLLCSLDSKTLHWKGKRYIVLIMTNKVLFFRTATRIRKVAKRFYYETGVDPVTTRIR